MRWRCNSSKPHCAGPRRIRQAGRRQGAFEVFRGGQGLLQVGHGEEDAHPQV